MTHYYLHWFPQALEVPPGLGPLFLLAPSGAGKGKGLRGATFVPIKPVAGQVRCRHGDEQKCKVLGDVQP